MGKKFDLSSSKYLDRTNVHSVLYHIGSKYEDSVQEKLFMAFIVDNDNNAKAAKSIERILPNIGSAVLFTDIYKYYEFMKESTLTLKMVLITNEEGAVDLTRLVHGMCQLLRVFIYYDVEQPHRVSADEYLKVSQGEREGSSDLSFLLHRFDTCISMCWKLTWSRCKGAGNDWHRTKILTRTFSR